jgi:fatty-acyl-CoA synthase
MASEIEEDIARDWEARRCDPVSWWAERTPHRAALIDARTGYSYTWRQFDAEVARTAGLLRSVGVERGERVATLLGNRVELIALLFAAARVGAALVPLNWRLTAEELRPILAGAAAALVVTEERHRSLCDEALRPAASITSGHGAPPTLDVERNWSDAAAGDVVAPARPHADDPAIVLYTSGSTGRPKGAVLPHRQLVANAVATCRGWGIGPDDVVPITTPLFHTGGWNVLATPAWYVGGTVVLMEGFEPETFLDLLDRHRCSFTLVVPTQLYMLTQTADWGRPLPHLDRFVLGGAPCPPALAARVRSAGYRLQEGYGLTECGPNCFRQTPEESAERPGWVGEPVPLLEVRLRSDAGVVYGAGSGELQLRGPQVFSGYLSAPERTAEAFDDGWLRTGDIAERSESGHYRICGRIKEMFISGGENVYPAEVEAVLADHPAVSSVCVVGVPDPKWGEVGRAWIVLRPGHAVAAADIRGFAGERLAGYKIPKSVGFLDELPLLGSGKVNRTALERMELPSY